MKQIYLFPGQWAYSREPAEISTILGSCVGVALHDYKLKTGALNHYLLSTQPSEEASSTRYGSTAVPTIIEALLKDGSEIKHLQAKIYGGANVLSGVTIGDGIGNKNVSVALQILEQYKIPIIEQDIGGLKGRRLSFFTHNFEIKHSLQGGEKEIVDTTGFGILETTKKVRVVIVDDSATIRTLFQKVFQLHGIEVVGTAANAYEAREIIVETKPDVITLDLEMPKMNGVVFLEKLMKHMPMPVVIVSSLGSQGEAALRTLELGAIEFIHKPTQFDPTLLKQLGEMLVEKVKAAASVNVLRSRRTQMSAHPKSYSSSNSSSYSSMKSELKAIVIGGNAGSTESLRAILETLPSDTPPVIIANSTIVPFLETYLEQLRRKVQVQLSIAQQDDFLRNGRVYFAPENMHVRIISSGFGFKIDLKNETPVCGQKPSSTVLFESASTTLSSGVIAILLGGFGSDGVDGLQKIKASGGVTLVENPDKTQFPYAPQKAIAIGVADYVLMASEMSQAMTEQRNRRVVA